MRIGTSVVCALALLAFASVARAGGVEDGEAGLAALNSGDYDTAIRLFTRAILIGKLSPNDSEFAYLNRGSAFEAKGDHDHALADFQKAVQIKPDDADAQTALRTALDRRSGGGSRVPGNVAGQAASREGPITGAPGDPWGLMSAMVGRYFWVDPLGRPPHESFARFTWLAPQSTLSYQQRSKAGQLVVSEFKIDPQTGKIIFSALSQNNPIYGTVEASARGYTETTFIAGAPNRFITTVQRDGSLVEARQVFMNGGWRDTTTTQLSEATPEDLAAAGLMKVKKKR